jgi:hypothetical protein
MNKTILFTFAIAFGLSQTAFAAYMDITRPGDPLTRVDGYNQTDDNDGEPPAGEVASHAIDDVGQKYLNFLDLSSGFVVTPSGNADNLPIVGLRLYTANDAEDRDPASFQLSGSNDGDGAWTYIASGNLSLPADRNPGGDAVAIPPTGNLDAFNQTILFDNELTFQHYQVIFPTIKNAFTANSMQIAEVELLAAIPEPTTGLMLGIGLLGIAGAARRRRDR